mgnify:CR=1 FL=1
MKWIAVDYGERRTGLAVCDASELIVTPVTPQIEEKMPEQSSGGCRRCPAGPGG